MSKTTPPLGRHLAVLNLFREADGKLYITVADAQGAMTEQREKGVIGVPIDYVEALIYDAATTTLKPRLRGETQDGDKLRIAVETLERWDICNGGVTEDFEVHADPTGEWVKHEDIVAALKSTASLVARVADKPAFDYKAEGLKLFPAPQGNARREGWNAYFEGRPACPFPPNRRDLLQGFKQGWDEAEEFDPR